MKKTIAILLCVVMIFSFAACSKGSKNNEITNKKESNILKGFSSPEDMLKKTFEPILRGKMDWGLFWENYTSETTKNLKFVTKDMFMINMRKKYPVLSNGYTDFKVTDRQVVDKKTYRVDFTLTFKNSKGEKVNREFTEYVVEQSGEFKLVYDGIFRWKSFEKDENKNEISITQVDIKYGYDKVDIDLTFVNNADMGRFVGETSGANMTVKTSEKTYAGKINAFVIKSGETEVATAVFDELKGTAKSFELKNIYEIDKNGKAVFTNDDGITFSMPLE